MVVKIFTRILKLSYANIYGMYPGSTERWVVKVDLMKNLFACLLDGV